MSWTLHSQGVVTSARNRKEMRRAVHMTAQLRERGSPRFEVEIMDLSIGGFRGQTGLTLWPGTRVWITLPGLAALEAVVAWRDRYRFGCAFAGTLHPAVLDHLAARNRVPLRFSA